MTDGLPPDDVLRAPLVIEFPFSRTVGPVQSAFLTGLREHVVIGVRGTDGRVHVPPCEYDPVTSDELTELVEVRRPGTVTTWAWEPNPRPNQPLDEPFAWALVTLRRCRHAMLHAVAADHDEMATGMAVQVRWADEREGHITRHRLLRAGPMSLSLPASIADVEPVRSIRTPARLDYEFTAGLATSQFLRAVKEKKLIGGGCPVCGKVYVPPRGSCPIDGVPTTEQVEVADTRHRHDVLRRQRPVLRPGGRDALRVRHHPARRRRPRPLRHGAGDARTTRSASACGSRPSGSTTTSSTPRWRTSSTSARPGSPTST